MFPKRQQGRAAPLMGSDFFRPGGVDGENSGPAKLRWFDDGDRIGRMTFSDALPRLHSPDKAGVEPGKNLYTWLEVALTLMGTGREAHFRGRRRKRTRSVFAEKQRRFGTISGEMGVMGVRVCPKSRWSSGRGWKRWRAWGQAVRGVVGADLALAALGR